MNQQVYLGRSAVDPLYFQRIIASIHDDEYY